MCLGGNRAALLVGAARRASPNSSSHSGVDTRARHRRDLSGKPGTWLFINVGQYSARLVVPGPCPPAADESGAA